MAYRLYGDWGTSRLRLHRIERRRIVSSLEGPGIAALAVSPEILLGELAAQLVDPERPPAATNLCGMIGSSLGWLEAPYAGCPAGVGDWRKMSIATSFAYGRVTIAAGLACVDNAGIADIMRGEETQLFGALALQPGLADGDRLVVLPGTHSKWTRLQDGQVTAFRTVPTGELYATLRSHSTLLAGGVDSGPDEGGFADGLARGLAGPGILSGLFAARSMRLRSGRSKAWADDYLSGLLIGGEIAELAPAWAGPGPVFLVGEPKLCERYRLALAGFGVTANILDASACTIAGLSLLDDAT